ncbi:MAG: hypothetical protein KC731_35695, partial [Myxococcales bacterium]|nr:hypothetical protein [Myxococcales bacterium]
DRGIYRPGSTIGIKATAMRPEGAELRPVKGQARHLRLRDPKGETICEHAVTTNDMGSAAADCHVPHGASLGLYRVEVRRGDAVEGHSLVRVADFEPPRFKVDVDAKATRAEDRASLSASVDAKYLFGSPMSGGNVRWSLERRPAPFPNGPLTAAGLSFRPEPSWIYDEEQVEAKWSRVGEGMLDEAGRLSLTQALPMDGADGPQRFVLEADVSDASYRHVANRAEVVVDAAPVYAGLRGPSGWVRSGGDVSVELGAIDGEGRSVIGKTVTATLFEVTWRYLERLGPGGAIHTEWRRQEVERGRCSVVSAERAERCDLRALSGGDYRLVASVDGRSGGSSWFWVWGDDGEKRKTTPSRGPVVQVVADKGRYQAGETAKLLVRSPYPAATMVTTFEMGGLVGHESQRITGPVGLVNVPIRAEHAPHLHASITLLPMGAVGRDRASYRVGAIRLPVDGKSAALAVKVASDRPSYRPRDEATVTVEVQADGKPLPHAEVALAVVDEGVLRLTGFHAPNPGDALRPPMALDFVAFDSREGLLGLFERSHVAGDGGGEGDDSLPHARRRFVETALWRPMLRTDAAGKAQVRFTLPDNLTEFRMMAVAVDPAGRSGNEEASFLVKKDLMVDPILPRFAHVGDRFELAAMVHNGSDQPFDGSVQLDTVQVPVSLPAGARKRVATTTDARSPGLREITVALRDAAGEVKDAAKRRLPVQQPGYAVHPSLAGAFREELKIDLTLPASAMLEPEESLTLKLGEHLWPELGTRLEYLLDYPHGCVEQTTSSTLPLVAGREILPRIGLDRHDARFFTDRIKAGVDRLATMRTSSGGLAYWPGDSDPSIFGTAYAIRAVSAAHDAGIPLSPGLLEGMTSYLEARLREESTSIELRAVIAESLAAMPQGLPPGIADALWDRRGDMSAFARASLTLALARDAAQADRVRTLSDDLVALLDDQGKLREEPAVHHEYYGSPQRTESQIARALTATRPDEPRLLLLASRLAEVTGRYTTQATAFTLLALADYLQGLPAEGVTIAATLDGEPLAQRRMASGAVEVSIPLAELVGKKRRLRVKGDGKTALGYALAARYRLPLGDESLRGEARAVAELEGASGKAGPHVYRMITTPAGDPVDPSKVAAGELLRVALLVDFPSGAERRYLALTDPLPAGLEPVQTDLASVTNDPGIGDQHPLADHLRWSLHQISHLELHDDRMQLYVDDVGSSVIAASYLVRATTPGTFATPPAMAELMYQAGSTSFTEGSEITIQ